MHIIPQLIISCLTAYFYGRIIYYCFSPSKNNNCLIAKLHSFYLGLGYTSITFWFYTLLTNGNNKNYHVIEICSVFFIYLYLFFKHRKNKQSIFPLNRGKKSNNQINDKHIHFHKPNISYLGFVATIIILLLSILCFIKCIFHPDGAWDAVSMWNLKAKFLSCGNKFWSSFFSNNFDYAHRDYPLFLPCSLARISNYIGGFNQSVSMLLCCFFSICFYIFPYLYLKKLKNSYYALFALCILTFSPYAYYLISLQYADNPLAVFFIISIYELISWNENNVNKQPWLCIFFSSLCFWTKNEGIPFLIIYFTILLYYLYKKEIKPNNTGLKTTLKKSFKLLLGILPVLLSVIAVRYLASSENDLVLGVFGRFNQLFDSNRYLKIATFLWSFLKSHIWIFIIPLSFLLGFIDTKYKKYNCLLVLVLFMYIIYFLTYLITPHDLQWHLRTSFTRITSHFLPSLVFLGSLLFNKKNKNL